ncbi:hypothetical protein AVEN_105537-1, partial [Araneus ventricosus]
MECSPADFLVYIAFYSLLHVRACVKALKGDTCRGGATGTRCSRYGYKWEHVCCVFEWQCSHAANRLSTL